MRKSASSTIGEPLCGLALISLRRPCAQQKASRSGLPPVRFDVARLNELEIADSMSSGFRSIQVIHEGHPFSDFWWDGVVQGSHPVGWVECFVHQMTQFLRAIDGDHAVAPFAANFQDGYRTAEIGDTMVKSWHSGRREKVDYRDT